MSTRQALVIKSAGEAEVREIPRPKLKDDRIIVKTKAVALNPTDWKTLFNPRTDPAKPTNIGAVLGCDYAGIVEEVGKDVTAAVKPGDRVGGFTFGGSPHDDGDGAFATIVTGKGHTLLRVDPSISFAEAATLGVGITTVGQGLYQSTGIPLPPAKVQDPSSVLIYGASTATGTLAVQFAKLSGLKVYATSSPRNFDLVKKLGADEVFDYKDPECGAKIRAASNDSLSLVFDTISEGSSPAICAAAIGTKGGQYATLLPVADFPRPDVKVTHTLGYTAFGVDYSDKYPASKADAEFAAKFWSLSQDLLNQGKIKTHPAEVREGGLEGIKQGLLDLKEGKVSGVKLVYTFE